jgi:hypothetical protein
MPGTISLLLLWTFRFKIKLWTFAFKLLALANTNPEK